MIFIGVFFSFLIASTVSTASTAMRDVCVKSIDSLALAPIYENPLPEDLVTEILTHEALSKLRDRFGDDSHLSFEFGHLTKGRSFTGEVLQEAFLKKILQLLFPVAHFDGGPLHVNSLHVWISDLAEFGSQSEGTQGDLRFPMALFKPANPVSLGGWNRETLRNKLGIFQEEKVVSIYARGALEFFSSECEAFIDKNLALLMNAALVGAKANLVIVSGRPASKLEDAFENNLVPGFRSFERAKEFKLSSGMFKRPAFVLNDTRGFLPYWHAVSDIALIRGAINLFEPLQNNVPTISFNTPTTLGYYERNVWRELLRISALSGRFTEISDPSALTFAIEELLRKKPHEVGKPPYLIVDPKTGRTSFQYLLDRLAQELNKKL